MEKYIDLISQKYPFTIEDIRRKVGNKSLPLNPTPEQLRKYDFCLVKKVPRPTGLLVTEGQPRNVEGVFYQTWSIREPETFNELNNETKHLIRIKKEKRLGEGYLVEEGFVIELADSWEYLTDLLLQSEFSEGDKSTQTTSVFFKGNVYKDFTLVESGRLAKEALALRRDIIRQYKSRMCQVEEIENFSDLKGFYSGLSTK